MRYRLLISLLLSLPVVASLAATQHTRATGKKHVAKRKLPTCKAWCLAPVKRKYYASLLLGLGEGTGNSDIGFAYGVTGGYRVNSNVSSEVLFMGMRRGEDGNFANSYLFGGDFKFSLPFSPLLTGFAKFGITIVHSTAGLGLIPMNRFGWLFGGGVQYKLDTHWSATGQVLGTTGGDGADTLALLGGLQYLF